MSSPDEKKEKISTRRTYTLLRAGFFKLLSEIPFEKITLTQICSRSMVPRSTFYRYFEDKYDLLCYCLQTFFEEAEVEDDVLYLKESQSARAFLLKLIKELETNRQSYYKIYTLNKDGAFMDILRSFLIQILSEKLKVSEEKGIHSKISPPIFTYLLADFYISTAKCYLEYADSYTVEEYVKNVALFANKNFFS
ncbi:MAG: TetR family transcriptional regulator [Hungatella sp.]|nr:TetR family transcriptional regulator [Hungatella sp.]